MKQTKRIKVSQDNAIQYYQIIIKYDPRLINILANIKYDEEYATYYKGELITDVKISKNARDFLESFGYTFEKNKKQKISKKETLFGVPIKINGSLIGRTKPPENITIVIRGDDDKKDFIDNNKSLNENITIVREELKKLNFNFDITLVSKDFCEFLKE